MPSEETVHVSPVEVTPTLGKGTLGTWWFRRSAGRSDSEPTMSLTCEMELGLGQTMEAGAYANQRLNLTKLGRLKEERPGLRTGPGKSGRTGLSGGLGKRGHGGNVNPLCNRKGRVGNPPPTDWRARALSQPIRSASSLALLPRGTQRSVDRG